MNLRQTSYDVQHSADFELVFGGIIEPCVNVLTQARSLFNQELSPVLDVTGSSIGEVNLLDRS